MSLAESPSPSPRARPGRPRGPRRSRAERRVELLDAAERAIRRVGPNVSMDELAAEAGITKPILYSHFGDRAGLADALADRTADNLIHEVTVALQEALATGMPKDVTRAAVLAFFDFIEREPRLYRFLITSTFDRGGPASSRLVTGVAGRVGLLLAQALEELGEDTTPAEPWAYGVVGLAFAGAEWWIEYGVMEKEVLVDHLTRLLWGGMVGAGLDSDALGRVLIDLTPPEPSSTGSAEAAGAEQTGIGGPQAEAS